MVVTYRSGVADVDGVSSLWIIGLLILLVDEHLLLCGELGLFLVPEALA